MPKNQMQPQAKYVSNRYQLLDILGEGGIGSVYRAFDRLTQTEVALKQLTVDSTSLLSEGTTPSRNDALALAREFRILASMRHPHIVPVLDYGFDVQPYFTMRLLDKAQPVTKLANSVSLETGIDLLRQLLLALIYLHRRHVLHRDLKPSNILVSENHHLRLVDFDIAIEQADWQSRAGTIRYMAPELLRGGNATVQSELYATGMIAYELFTASSLFDASQDDEALLQQGIERDAQIEQLTIPEQIRTFLQGMLASNPAERFPNAESALQQLVGSDMPETTEVRESFLQSAKFVGRKSELRYFNRLFADIRKGKTGATIYLIGGESGVGKSRLLDEIRIRAMVQGGLVLHGQAIAEGGAPFQLWRDIVLQLALETELSQLEASVLNTIAPELSRLLGRDIPDPPALSDETGHQRLVFTLVSLILRLNKPTIMLLEDLQWSQESLEPLRVLQRVMNHERLLVLGTYRNDERPNLPDELVGIEVAALERLNPTDVNELAVAVLGESGRNPDVQVLLQKETEGNTLFLVEAIRMLAEEAGQLNHIGQITLPDHIFTGQMASILQRRLSQIPQACQPLLKLAAIDGRDIDLKLLRHVSSRREVNVFLEAGHRNSVLEVQGEYWRFAHDKLREVLLAELGEDESVALHRQIAETIEYLYPDRADSYLELVRHWHMAGNAEKERKYAFLAGQYLADHYAIDEAIQYFSRAIELLPEDDEASAIQFRLAREELFMLTGDREQQERDLDVLMQLAENSGDPEKQVIVQLRYVRFATVTRVNHEEARQMAQSAIGLAEEAENPILVADVYYQLAYSLFKSSEFYQSLDMAEQALTIYQNLGQVHKQADTLDLLGQIVRRRSELEDAHQYYQQSLQLYQQLDYLPGQGRMFFAIGTIHGQQGDYELAEQYFERALDIAQKVGDREGVESVHHNFGVLYKVLGRYEEAMAHTEQCLAITRAMESRLDEALALMALGNLLTDVGKYDESERYQLDAMKVANDFGNPDIAAMCQHNLGTIAIEKKEYRVAKNYCCQALETFQNVGLPQHILAVQADLAFIGITQTQLPNAYFEAVMAYLDENPELKGVDTALVVYMRVYRCLQLLQDPGAPIYLEKAWKMLMEQYQLLSDNVAQKVFLEQVPLHQEIMKLYEAIN